MPLRLFLGGALEVILARRLATHIRIQVRVIRLKIFMMNSSNQGVGPGVLIL